MSAFKKKESKVKDRAGENIEDKKTMSKGELAIRKLTVSKKMKQDATRHGFHDPVEEINAKILNREGMELLEAGAVQRLVGNELVEANREDVSLFREVLKEPNSVSANASVERMRLFNGFGHLEMAVDASETIDAKNSLEKMLAHQMTACHVMSMRLMSKAVKYTDNLTTSYTHPNIEQATKVVNAAARLMDTFQRGLATISKIRSGGRQKVTVEHVHVNKGGQAIVGNVSQGGGVSRGGNEKEK